MSERRPFFVMPHPGIYRITCDLPFPGLDHVHVYLAEGPDGGLVVFDTAFPWEDSFDRIVQGVRWLDRDITDLERIYLTHAHPDHITQARALQEASGAVVVCHPIAHRNFEKMQHLERWDVVLTEYARHGWDPDAPREGGMEIPLPDRFEHIDEGDSIEFAGGAWDVYHTPGHEEGHVAFFRASDGVLLSGDTLLGKITPHIGYLLEPADPLGQFLDSLDKITGLDPSLVLPGHGRPFDEGAERAQSTKTHHLQRLRRIMEILLRSGPLPATEISKELFGRDLMFFQARLALAETLAHLEHLRLQGRLEREEANGLWHYKLGGSGGRERAQRSSSASQSAPHD